MLLKLCSKLYYNSLGKNVCKKTDENTILHKKYHNYNNKQYLDQRLPHGAFKKLKTYLLKSHDRVLTKKIYLLLIRNYIFEYITNHF